MLPMSAMRFSFWLAIAAVMIAGALAGLLTRARRAPPPAPIAAGDAPTITAPTEPPTAMAARDFLGVVLTGQDVDVAPRVEGRVASVAVKPGDQVHRGQIVAVMDVRATRQSLRLAAAALADAEQRLARRTGMVEGVLSQEEIANARVLVLERRGRVSELRAAVEDASVRAPFDGAVAACFLEGGAIAGPSRPILRVVGASRDVRIRFAIPEELAGTVSIGAHARMVVKSLRDPLPIVVDSVAPEVDSAARVIFAVARLQSGGGAMPTLAAGMVARVLVGGGSHERGVSR